MGKTKRSVPSGCSAVNDHLKDVGDDVAGALHLDPTAAADVEAGDLIGVEKTDVSHGHSTDNDGHEDGERRELAGAADGDLDFADLGDGCARGEFIRDGPAWGAAGVAEAELGILGINFNDGAIDLVAEGFAGFFDLGEEGENLVDGGEGVAMWIDAEAEGW